MGTRRPMLYSPYGIFPFLICVLGYHQASLFFSPELNGPLIGHCPNLTLYPLCACAGENDSIFKKAPMGCIMYTHTRLTEKKLAKLASWFYFWWKRWMCAISFFFAKFSLILSDFPYICACWSSMKKKYLVLDQVISGQSLDNTFFICLFVLSDLRVVFYTTEVKFNLLKIMLLSFMQSKVFRNKISQE